MRDLRYYNAGVADLEFALSNIEEVNQKFPQYRVPTGELKRSLKNLRYARDKREQVMERRWADD